MLVTAIVKDNNLIIPNIDINLLTQQPNEFGLVEFELPILKSFEMTTIAENTTSNQPTKPFKKSLTVKEMLQKMPIKTNKVATIEEMNESIAQAYKNWEC